MRAILTYHSIDTTQSPISIRPDAFAAHVRWLASGRVRVLPLERLVAESRAGDGGGDAVAITFDDGFENFAEHAAPLLRDHGLAATVFVVSGRVGRTNAWGGRDQPGIPTLPLMSWDALGRLSAQGIALGGHTTTHPALGSLPDVAMRDEIDAGVREMKSRLGVLPSSFAYPYGIAPAAAADHVRREFAVGVTTELRALGRRDDPALLPRLDAFYLRAADGLDGWGTARFRAYLGLRAAVRFARARMRRGAGAA